MTTPVEKMMENMAKIAIERATETLCMAAEQFAPSARDLNGEEALLAFARAIRITNSKVFEPEGALQ